MKKLVFFFFIIFSASCGQNEVADNKSKSNNKDQREINKKNAVLNEKASLYLDPALHPYTEFTYITSSKSVFITERGTTIEIPKGAFNYKSGERVEKNVSIKFKEFHTPGEIILSGIPMEYDSSGIKKTFQSAGMFEIRAYADGEEVVLADGKTVMVELASNKEGNFNFYRFNDSEQDWKMLASATKPEKNRRREKRKDSLQRELTALKKPKAPNPYRPGDKLFDIYFNTKLFPDYAALNGVMWKYTGEEKGKDPAINKKFSSTEWEVVRIEPGNDEQYLIRFEKDRDTVSVLAQPVFQGAVLTKENEKFKQMLENFNADYNRIANERKRADNEMALLRKFNLKEMGIYNYDRYYKDPEVIPLLAEFDFHKQINLRSNPVSVFLVPKGENAVIRYTPETYEKFSFNPDKINMLIAILPDKTICTYSNDGFKKIKPDTDKQAQRYMFNMKNEDKIIQSPKDLDELLAKKD